MATKKKGECCELMTIALARTASLMKPQGMAREELFDFSGKRRPAVYPTIVLHLPKATKEDKSAWRKATYAMVNYCPFCGAKVAKERDGKKSASGNVPTA